jgi:hypothetical protein
MRSDVRNVFTCLLAVAALMFFNSFGIAQSQEGKLAAKRYVDPKGYFKIVPPDKWRVQEYPQDPRGKVAFLSPESNIDLRVLVNAVDFTTMDELVSFCKNVEKRTGLSTNVQKTEFGGRPVVKRSFEAKGMKCSMIDFLVGSVDHNIQFCSPPKLHQKYLPLVTKSMETYEAILKDLSKKDALDHFVAKKLRLAQLMMDNGNHDLARTYIKEGLEMAPRDTKLLELKEEIDRRQGGKRNR